MKKYIEMDSDEIFEEMSHRFNNHASLNEKIGTYNISKDIDYIYKRMFSSLVKDMKKDFESKKKGEKLSSGFYKKFVSKNIESGIGREFLGIIPSGDLPSKISAIASSVQKTSIRGYGKLWNEDISSGSSFYQHGSYIEISPNRTIMRLIYNPKSILSINQKNRVAEYLKSGLQQTIAHELTHWIQFTSGGKINKDYMNLLLSIKKGHVDKLVRKDVYMTATEMQSTLAELKFLKSKKKKEWDQLTINDLFILNWSIGAVLKSIHHDHGQKTAEAFLKAMLILMAKNNLVGKKMRDKPDWEMIKIQTGQK